MVFLGRCTNPLPTTLLPLVSWCCLLPWYRQGGSQQAEIHWQELSLHYWVTQGCSDTCGMWGGCWDVWWLLCSPTCRQLP